MNIEHLTQKREDLVRQREVSIKRTEQLTGAIAIINELLDEIKAAAILAPNAEPVIEP